MVYAGTLFPQRSREKLVDHDGKRGNYTTRYHCAYAAAFTFGVVILPAESKEDTADKNNNAAKPQYPFADKLCNGVPKIFRIGKNYAAENQVNKKRNKKQEEIFFRKNGDTPEKRDRIIGNIFDKITIHDKYQNLSRIKFPGHCLPHPLCG